MLSTKRVHVETAVSKPGTYMRLRLPASAGRQQDAVRSSHRWHEQETSIARNIEAVGTTCMHDTKCNDRQPHTPTFCPPADWPSVPGPNCSFCSQEAK